MRHIKKRKYRPAWAVIVTVLIGSIYGAGLYGYSFEELASRKRADVILIDSMAAFGGLEKPPVEFLHDKHTGAIFHKNMDCTACHLKKNNFLYPKFKRIDDTDRIAVMNIYHEGCISCHGKMKVAKEKTGPIECDACHRKKAQHVSSRQSMGLDKSLHFRHLEARNNKCQECHHEYNETEKTLYYVKGKEGSCRYCHEQKTKENRIAMRLASHIACINCHARTKSDETSKPPVNCSGCHDAAAQKKIKKATTVPRMKRKQPDTVLLKSIPKDLEMDKGINKMNLVLFDHKAHENYNDTCRDCHHENLNACKECHTLNGSAAGKGVSLENAMHNPVSKRSCIGCHDDRKETGKCAGCHLSMGRNHKSADASCSKCHAIPIFEILSDPHTDHEKLLAERIFQSRIPIAETYPGGEVPERVIIKRLSNQYEPVDFPHLQVVNALISQTKDDKLAGYFHSPKDTICQGCHHNSPVSRRPPNCGYCHVKQWNPDYPTRPGLLGAYHLQCMGCHKAMNIEKPVGCTPCHKKKISSN